MAIFKKKKLKETKALPPEEEESQEELETEEDEDEEEDEDDEEEEEPVKKKIIKKIETPSLEKKLPEYREIPVCLSQAQINNLVIENNMILKQIISNMEA